MKATLTRRELLSESTVLLLLVPAIGVLAACGSTSSGSGPAGSTCDGIDETSTVTNAHTHTLCVPSSDIATPPASGVTYTTSTDAGHNHTVQLSQQQLQTINGGGSVTVTTSAPYAHNFTIQKS